MVDRRTSRRRPCPLCGRLESTTLFRQSFEQLSDTAFLSGYDVVVCETCGFAFADGIPHQELFDVYYRDLSKYEFEYRHGKESASDEARFRDIAKTLARFIPFHSARV